MDAGGEGHGGANGAAPLVPAPKPRRRKAPTKEALARANERKRDRRRKTANIFFKKSVAKAGGYDMEHRDDLQALCLLCDEAGYQVDDDGIATKKAGGQAGPSTAAEELPEEEAPPAGLNLDLGL